MAPLQPASFAYVIRSSANSNGVESPTAYSSAEPPSRCSAAIVRTTSRNSRGSCDSGSNSFQNRVRFLRSYEVRIVGTSQQNIGVGVGRMGRNYYHVQVSVAGADVVITVQRRYSEFARLHALMKSRYADLPDMPPKSQFRKRASGKFLDNRQEALGNFLGVAVALDPTIADPDLRLFLQTPALLDPSVTRSGNFPCVEDDGDDDECTSQRTLSTDPDPPGDAALPGVFRAREHDTESSSSSDSDTESGDEVDVPRTFEIFERLGELRATNATLEAENKAIIQDVSRPSAPPREAVDPSRGRAAYVGAEESADVGAENKGLMQNVSPSNTQVASQRSLGAPLDGKDVVAAGAVFASVDARDLEARFLHP